jgi:hypothetical protein
VNAYRSTAEQLPRKDVYVRLGRSKVNPKGIGAFAVKRIPKNTRLFAGENEEIVWIDEAKLPKDPAVRELYSDFAVTRDGWLGCPPSFNRLTPAWFMSTSAKPNTRLDENYDFYALREIPAGDELSVDIPAFKR